MTAAVECRKVSKAYGFAPALREIDLVVERGTRLALLGDNGAGKSTLLKVLATLLRPDSGQCRVLGEEVAQGAQKVRGRLGYLGHDSMLDRVQTMRENLAMFARLYGVADAAGVVASLIEKTGAAAFADNPVGELSRGQEQAAALARALVHGPELLLLDEPANALDPSARERLEALLQEQSRQGASIIFSSHDHDWAKSMATRVVVMAGGRIVEA
ncbi:MAG: ABC transporter ATP-binding protein [Planctomycetaceae bacterium]|nr:ABC transporter ATP-binding protein NatA [Planctomycetota bacterium]MCQ3950841.1 sodium ABC transporter ATP-binding protein [Planctomycetota bacterium]NUO16404.1 ABC transporter ATP-binding protein [Planctomycetaceae bacterium]GIK52619.1 MAG: ABC transporter ATP-binding protein [Planctomycetota bacterium]HRJ77856.1 ABC transporter ATP-binding protein [Planctomycetota bacterium]